MRRSTRSDKMATYWRALRGSAGRSIGSGIVVQMLVDPAGSVLLRALGTGPNVRGSLGAAVDGGH